MRANGLVAAFLIVMATEASAESVAFFNDAGYVDAAEEGAHLSAALAALGHTVVPFTGVTEATWGPALGDADVLVIPELERENLFAALTSGAKTAIALYVTSGGCLITNDNTNPFFSDNTVRLLNGLFAYSLVGAEGVQYDPSSLVAGEAVGTPFAGGPASLPASNAVEGVLTSSLPIGARNLYHIPGTDVTTVFALQVGAGRATHLGFDWYEVPTPSSWQTVLSSAVHYCSSGPVSVESTTWGRTKAAYR